MFKFRNRNKNQTLVVRTEDLQVGDKLVYENAYLEVLDVTVKDTMTTLRLGSPHPDFRIQTRTVEFYNELLTLIVR